MATRIPVRFRKFFILLHLSVRTRQISTSHQNMSLRLFNPMDTSWDKEEDSQKNVTHAKAKKVQVGKDQEKAQSEKVSHSKNRGGKKPK